MTTDENDDLPVPDLRTMEELCHPTLNGRGGPIAPIAIQATNLGLKNDMIQQVQNSCQFHGLPGDDANKHLDKFLHVTQSIKVNGVTDDALCLYLFPHSLTHHAIDWFDRLPRNSINTFEKMAKMFLGKYFPPSMATKLRNEITNFHQRPDESLFEAWERYKLLIDRYNYLGPSGFNQNQNRNNQNQNFQNQNRNQGNNHGIPQGNNQGRNQFFQGASHGQNSPLAYQASAYQALGYQAPVHQASIPQPQVVTTIEFINYMKANVAILKNMQTNMTSLTNSNLERKNMFGQFMKMNTALSSILGTLLNLDFNISFADALILMPKFGPTIKSLLTNKEELYELARTLLNEHFLAILLKKLPKKLKDPDKFLIPCDFPRMDECLALADLGASINIMPFSVWNKLSLPELSPTCMNLELVDRLISRPVGVAKDVLISFLKTRRDLIDVYERELTLRVGKEAVTFNLDQTLRYSANYDAMSVNQIDLIDVACEEYSQEVLGFSVNAFIAIDDEPISPEINEAYYDSEGDILLLEEFINDDPSSPPLPLQELKVVEPTNEKSSIDEAPMVELKDLPPHLEYAFLEGDDKLPVIIAKDLKDEEETALIKVLKSHKQALAWQLSDIKGINPEFCTHKILMEDDFKPAVPHQRRVNPKIYEVIKKEVLKILDFGLIYPISDTPWVSPVHCIPKKGGFTVVENEENELIPTRLVTGWSVCIDYRKLNDATHKDHFPLPTMEVFMDDFSVFGNSFETCLSHLGKILKQYEDTNLCLNWEKSHFMVKEGIVLGHKISKNRIKVDKTKVDVITKLPHPTTVKGIRSFLGHASFYRRFIQDFSKIARPMTRLLEKNTSFFFSKECVEAFQTLKRKLTEAPTLFAPDWDLPLSLCVMQVTLP
nr:DNA-directed DNA polymerase [Tanacetum cinerariifolium]